MFGTEEPRFRRRAVAHGGELEELPPKQIAVDQEEGDQVDARHQQQEQRQNIAENDDAEKFGRAGNRLAERQGPAGRLVRIIPRFDHFGDVVEEQAGDQRRHRRQKQGQRQRQTEAREDAEHEGEPAGPGGRAGHQRIEPWQGEPDEEFAQPEPECCERQKRQAEHLPEHRSGLRCKKIGERKPRRVQNHQMSPVPGRVR
ncbi:hypothetical protein D3C87_1511030 [compost metagenome]